MILMALSIKHKLAQSGVILNGQFQSWRSFAEILKAEALAQKISHGRARDDLRDVLLAYAGLFAVAVLGWVTLI